MSPEQAAAEIVKRHVYVSKSLNDADVCDDREELRLAIAKAIRDAVAEEREACLKAVDEVCKQSAVNATGWRCYEAIKARGQAK